MEKKDALKQKQNMLEEAKKQKENILKRQQEIKEESLKILKEELDLDKLYVHEASVGKGLVMKRFRPRAKGRGVRILKRFSNLTIKLKEQKEQIKKEIKDKEKNIKNEENNDVKEEKK